MNLCAESMRRSTQQAETVIDWNKNGRDCNSKSTVDGRSKRECYWTRASCYCGRLQIGDV